MSNLWFNSTGEVAHPGSPAGGGGAGHFRSAGVWSAHDSAVVPHPFSPAGRNHVLSKQDVSVLKAWIRPSQPVLTKPVIQQMRTARKKSQTTLQNIRQTMRSISAGVPAVSGSAVKLVDQSNERAIAAVEESVKDFIHDLWSAVGSQANHYAARSLVHRLPHFATLERKLAPLLENVLGKIANADVRLSNINGWMTRMYIPEAIRAGDLSRVTAELDELESEYVGLMRQIVTQHPSAPSLGKFIAEHLKILEGVAEALHLAGPAVEALFLGRDVRGDLQRDDYQGLAVDTFLLLFLMVLLVFMPEAFIVFFFAKPYLKFVEASIKGGPTLSVQIATAHGYNPNLT
ncbi:MAG: hypothetical protein WA803_22265, partial [Steroidobacteraceae bacterium]